MGWLQDVAGLFRRRTDSPLALPTSPTPPKRHFTRQKVRHDSLFNPLTNMGSAGDKSEVARPNTFVQPLNDEELRALYNFNGIARRAVDIFPEFAVREGWVVEGADPSEDKRLQLKHKVQEAMVLAQLYGGSALLLVTLDDIPAGPFRAHPEDWLAQPLELDRIEQLAAIQVFDTFEAHPLHERKDPADPDYRRPEFWSIGSHGFYATVHGSRVIQFDGRYRIPSERWSRATFGGTGIFNRQQNASYLQAVYDQIRHLAEAVKAGAIGAQEMQKSVYKIAGLDAVRGGDQADDLLAKVRAGQRASGILGANVIGEGDDFFHVAGTATGFRDLTDAQMQLLSLVTGIPRMVWFGDQPAGMSTDGDASWKGWRLKVNAFQEKNRPQLERLYQVMASARDRKNTIDPDDILLTFQPLDEPTDLEKGQVRLVTAQADAIEVQSGVLSPDEIRKRYESEDGYQVELPALESIDPEEAAMRVQLSTAAKAPVFGGGPGEGDEQEGPPERGENGPPTPAK